MFDHVGQRLLDHAVERRLRFGREPLLAELCLQVDLEAALLAEGVRQSFDCGDEAEVVERGWPELDREAPDVLQRRDHQLAHGLERCPRFGGLGRLLQRLQPQQDRRQRLTRLVVQLARQAGSFELLRLDDTPDGVAADALGEVDGDRSTRAERLSQTKIVLGECRRRPLLVVGDHDPDRPPPHEQRHVKPGVDAHTPGRLLVDLRIVEQRVDPLTSTALENAAGLRAAERQLHPGHAVRAFALGSGHAQHVTFRECDQDELRVDELLQPPRHQAQERLELEFRRERVSHLVEGLELAQPAGRVLVQPGVLDRYCGLRRQQLRQLGILVAEVLSARLLGQVQVPVRDPAKDNRHPEERLHRGMVRWEADRARVVGDVVQPQRLRVPNQDAEDAAPVRRVTDRGMRVGIDPGRQEPLQRLARSVDHAESCVAGVGDLGGRLDDPLQQRIERKLGAERDAGVDENAQAAQLICFAAHRSILSQRPVRVIETDQPREVVERDQERWRSSCGYTVFVSGLVPLKTEYARSMKPTPARISATPTTMLKIATPVAM